MNFRSNGRTSKEVRGLKYQIEEQNYGAIGRTSKEVRGLK